MKLHHNRNPYSRHQFDRAGEFSSRTAGTRPSVDQKFSIHPNPRRIIRLEVERVNLRKLRENFTCPTDGPVVAADHAGARGPTVRAVWPGEIDHRIDAGQNRVSKHFRRIGSGDDVDPTAHFIPKPSSQASAVRSGSIMDEYRGWLRGRGGRRIIGARSNRQDYRFRRFNQCIRFRCNGHRRGVHPERKCHRAADRGVVATFHRAASNGEIHRDRRQFSNSRNDKKSGIRRTRFGCGVVRSLHTHRVDGCRIEPCQQRLFVGEATGPERGRAVRVEASKDFFVVGDTVIVGIHILDINPEKFCRPRSRDCRLRFAARPCMKRSDIAPGDSFQGCIVLHLVALAWNRRESETHPCGVPGD